MQKARSYQANYCYDSGVVFQGAYRDDNGKPVVLNVVRQAEDMIAGSNFMGYVF